MIPDRRAYSLSPDQPILRRRRRSTRKPSPRPEADFWKHFDVEKLCRLSGPAERKEAGA